MAAGRDLAGALVGITAWRRADEQAELLARRGASVMRAPTIRLEPLGPDATARVATIALLDDPPDVVVANTGVGVRSWLALADSWGLGDALAACLGRARLVARGPKAAGALLAAGVQVDWRAPSGQLSEIVDHLVAGGVAGRRVAVQLDGSCDGDGALERLRQAGASVVAVPVYRWSMPPDTEPARRLVSAVADGRVDAVTFTAAPAVENFFAIAATMGMADGARQALGGPVLAVCVGPVCAAAAATHGVQAISPKHPRLGAMVQVLADYWSRRRRSVEVDGHRIEVHGALVAGSGAEVVLTGKAREVFAVLARRPGGVVGKAALAAEVWGRGASPRAVEATVGRLRRSLAPVGITVDAVRRRGYRLAVAPLPTPPSGRMGLPAG